MNWIFRGRTDWVPPARRDYCRLQRWRLDRAVGARRQRGGGGVEQRDLRPGEFLGNPLVSR
jgi:hypothetical protein